MRKGSTTLGSLGTVLPAAAAAGMVLLILPLILSQPGAGPSAVWAAESETPTASTSDGKKADPKVDDKASRETMESSKSQKAKQQPSKDDILKVIHTRATWYGPGFHGRRTASGERFNQNAMTLASRHLPFGTVVRVVNPQTGKSAVARVNDRGPFRGGYTADLSKGLAARIGMRNSGPVRLEILKPKKKAAAKNGTSPADHR